MGTLGALSGQAGAADFGRLLGGFGVGQQQAQQGDIGLQRLLNLFGGLFSSRQAATASSTVVQRRPSGTATP